MIGAAASVFFLWMSGLAGSPGWGRKLHQLFFYSGLYLAIAPAMRISVGLFSEERRNQTLELLYLTGMGSGQLFIGKLLGGTLIASSDLLALAPLLAVPFLIGGISLNLYLATIACLPALLLFAIAVGVLGSVLFKDDGVAFIFVAAFAGCVSLAAPIPYYLGKVLTGTPPFSATWLCLSPAYAPYLVGINFGNAGMLSFWMALLAMFAWSALCLSSACFFLSRNWRNEVQGTVKTGWQGWFDAWVFGARSWRAALRIRVLPANPFQWLVQQDRRPVLLAYCTIGLICVLWLIGWRAWPHAWPSNANFFITAMVLISVVNWLTLFAAARRIGTDRRDGILELLLTTPLSPQEMVDGEVAALAAEFKPLQRIVLSFLVLMMLGGFMIRSWNTRAAITYLLIWGFLCGWCVKNPKGRILKVMWAALNTGRPVHSVFRRRGNRWTWFWMFYNIRNVINGGFGLGTGAFPSGSILEFTLVCAIGVPAFVLYYLSRAMQMDLDGDVRRRLIMDMRLIATEPLPDPTDPRFKNWDGTHRLQYRASSTHVPNGWPVFVDPIAIDRPQAETQWAASHKVSTPDVIVPYDALDLCQMLHEQKVDYVMAGGLVMNAYLADRNIKDSHLLMSAGALKRIPELKVQERTDFFNCAQFRGIRVVIYLTSNPFFEAVQRQFATKLRVGAVEVPAASVEGLIALNLYALHLLSRQRDFYRNERYETDIIVLLARYDISSEPIMTLVKSSIPEQYQEELENTLDTCGERAARLRRQASRREKA
jgi:ABC-type transport system involved in cytochrome c biogenesis permease component